LSSRICTGEGGSVRAGLLLMGGIFLSAYTRQEASGVRPMWKLWLQLWRSAACNYFWCLWNVRKKVTYNWEICWL